MNRMCLCLASLSHRRGIETVRNAGAEGKIEDVIKVYGNRMKFANPATTAEHEKAKVFKFQDFSGKLSCNSFRL